MLSRDPTREWTLVKSSFCLHILTWGQGGHVVRASEGMV
jgi:hypothetical protein